MVGDTISACGFESISNYCETGISRTLRWRGCQKISLLKKMTVNSNGNLKGDIRNLFSRYGTIKGRPTIWGAIRIILVKPGVQALIFYRFYRKLYKLKLRLLAEFCSRLNFFFNGSEIDPGAEIGSGCRLWHPAGVVIGRGVKIGNNVSIFSNVTLGGLGHSIFHHGEPGYPEIGDNVILYTNVTILGPVKIGGNTTVGAHSLVLDSIPKNCLAAGNPAKIIKKS